MTNQLTSPAGRPNILFILTDDHAGNAISSYGSKINHTPNIDQIARAMAPAMTPNILTTGRLMMIKVPTGTRFS